MKWPWKKKKVEPASPKVCPVCGADHVHAYHQNIHANNVEMLRGRPVILACYHPTNKSDLQYIRCEGCGTHWQTMNDFLKEWENKHKEKDDLPTVIETGDNDG